MSEERVQVQISPMFFVKNLKIIFKMLRSNQEKLERFIDSNHRLDKAIYPSFEGTGGPMEEGMIYILFNSEGKTDVTEIDSVFRIFWVTAPQLKFHQLDSYFISSKLGNRQWVKFYDDLKFNNLSKSRFHQEVDLSEFSMSMDGTWQEGYKFNFKDNENNISANLTYKPLDEQGTLVYYNGRTAVATEAYQRFYDSFGINVNGKFEIDGKTIDISGRGIIEHGIGIFGTKVFHGWNWLNLQMEQGALHIFLHPVRRPNDSIFKAGEGAVVLDGQWYHILKNEVEIIPENTIEEDGRHVETSWDLIVKIMEERVKFDLNFKIESLTHRFWDVEISDEETHHVTNYVLKSSGSINGKVINAAGTMEIVKIEVVKPE